MMRANTRCHQPDSGWPSGVEAPPAGRGSRNPGLLLLLRVGGVALPWLLGVLLLAVSGAGQVAAPPVHLAVLGGLAELRALVRPGALLRRGADPSSRTYPVPLLGRVLRVVVPTGPLGSSPTQHSS